MAVVQSTYSSYQPVAYAGLVANGETANRISRTVETAAGIGFGKAVYRGSGDHGALLAQTLVAAGSEAAGNVGTGTITDAPTVAAGAIPGRYQAILLATSATAAFAVYDPNGVLVGHGNVATAFTGGGLTFTIANAGTMTIGDTFYVDVTGNAFLGISIAHEAQPLIAGQTADKYQQYANISILTSGSIWVVAGEAVVDGAPVFVDSAGDFVDSAGIPLPGWVFDTTGADDAFVKIVKR